MNRKDLDNYTTEKKHSRYFIGLLVGISIIMFLFFVFFHVNHVTGSSMLPTIQDGDCFISIDYRFCNIERGDIVNIKSVALEEYIIKRVIGVEGDTIEIDNGGKVYLNGEEIEEEYISEADSSYDGLSVTVPTGYIFVMGDNRTASKDSRKIGCISTAEIKGKVIWVFR